MNYLEILTKIINLRQKKQKASSLRNIAIFSAIGVAITGAAVILLAQSCSKEIRNMVIKKANELDEEINIKRDVIKHAVEEVGEESLGDVGIAIEDALHDLEDHKAK